MTAVLLGNKHWLGGCTSMPHPAFASCKAREDSALGVRQTVQVCKCFLAHARIILSKNGNNKQMVQECCLTVAAHLVERKARAVHEVGAVATEEQHQLIHHHVLQAAMQTLLSWTHRSMLCHIMQNIKSENAICAAPIHWTIFKFMRIHSV